MTTNVDIASKALARLGSPTIGAFDEDSDAAEKVALLYETTILDLFTRHDWRFAMTRAVLAVDAAAPTNTPWQRGFVLPDLDTDRVGPPNQVWPTTDKGAAVTFSYELQDRWLMTDHTVIVISYVQRKPENLWPGYFRKLAIEAVVAILALPITENQTKETYHQQLAFGSPSEGGRGGLFKTAVEADSAGNPTDTLLDDTDIMTMARFGGY